MLTTEQILEQTKTVTRRNGWAFLKEGDLLQPVYKSQGLKKGEKIRKLGEPIIVKEISEEPLNAITPDDVRLEGFPNMTPAEFVEMYCKANRCEPDKVVRRIEFGWLPC